MNNSLIKVIIAIHAHNHIMPTNIPIYRRINTGMCKLLLCTCAYLVSHVVIAIAKSGYICIYRILNHSDHY